MSAQHCTYMSVQLFTYKTLNLEVRQEAWEARLALGIGGVGAKVPLRRGNTPLGAHLPLDFKVIYMLCVYVYICLCVCIYIHPEKYPI